jgi:pimeloyl-ACP methyl ester carboxylesterase
MQPDELTAIGELTGDALAGIAGRVHGVHDRIARRVWSSVGPLGAPVRIAHDLVAAGAYSGVQLSARVLLRTGARALSTAVPDDSPSLERSATARIAIGVLNGAVGDSLERHQNALALRTTLRKRGQDIQPTRETLRAGFPAATGKLAVFLHGLGETDDAWWLGRERHQSYGSRLRRELGYTPLFIRYNTGRPVSVNGGELARLLDAVCSRWPVAVDEVVLIGHAMGGVVARSACEQAGEAAAWRSRVTHVLTLGTPDRGGRRVPFAADVEHQFVDYRRFGSIRRLQLLGDPAVYDQIRARLEAAPTPAPARAQLPARAAQRP